MNENDINRYLDGDADLEALDHDARAEARSWEHLLTALRTAHPRAPAPPWLEERVMAAIAALPETGSLGRAWRWLLRPWNMRLSPAAATVAVVALVGLGIALRSQVGIPGSRAGNGVATVVYVQFSLVAPGAASVSVGGDFDQWRASYTLEDPAGNGVWTGRVPIAPGVHTYMFLVDGSRWVTDPRAASYVDDGFGNKDAVLAVPAPST